MPRRTWTDDQLAAAVATATTWTEVMARLGVSRGGGSRAAAKRRAQELQLDTSHLPEGRGGVPRRWNDEQLRDAVAAARNLNQVFAHLGLTVGGGVWVRMQQHIDRLELDTSHWDAAPAGPDGRAASEPLPAWTDGQLREAFAGAASLSEVVRRLGADPARKRARREVDARLRALGLEPDRLDGRGWRRGRRDPSGHRGRPLDLILVAGSDYGSTPTLKRRLIAAGYLEPCCAWCGLRSWLGQPAPLHLDHVNGVRTDNRLDNLRLLCPNCHALTDTYCGRNVRRR